MIIFKDNFDEIMLQPNINKLSKKNKFIKYKNDYTKKIKIQKSKSSENLNNKTDKNITKHFNEAI